MNNQHSRIKFTALLLFIQTVIWIILTGISLSQISSNWDDMDFIKWAANPDIIYIINYINATLLTIVNIILFVLVFQYLIPNYENPAIVGIVFVPVYAALNIFSYSIQISLVPWLAQNALIHPGIIKLTSQLIQANYKSITGFSNGLAYAILGIPSIIFGLLLKKENKKYSGTFLFISGKLCIIGIIGYIIKNNMVASFTALGGVFFLLSLLCMFVEFPRKN